MKKQSLADNLKKLEEFEIAEALLKQSPRRIKNVLRIVNNMMFARNKGSHTTSHSRSF